MKIIIKKIKPFLVNLHHSFIFLKDSRSKSDFFYRSLKLFFKTIGFPNYGDYASTKLRILIAPKSMRKRKNLAKKFKKISLKNSISPTCGFLLFKKSLSEDIDKLINTCNKILDEKGRNNLESWFIDRSIGKSKNFFFNVLEEKDVLDNPELMNFILSEQILGKVIKYYGFVPQLSSMGIFMSPVNNDGAPPIKSQKYHLDGENQHLKCYVYLTDVKEDSGAFTFIPKDKTKELQSINGGKFSSIGVEKVDLLNQYDKEYSIKITGSPGNGGFIDTSSCLHYGSRCTKSSRLVFMFHFAVFANYKEYDKNPLRDLRLEHYPSIAKNFAKNELQKLVLSVG